MADDPLPPGRGIRRDGKPYKDGNTREDGSYANGYARAPEQHRFAVGDGRKRGPRPRGSKTLATEWNEELNAKITVTEGGRKTRITKRRSLIKTQIERGMRSSDRAAETAFRYAELGERRAPGLQEDDLQIIGRFLERYMATGDTYDEIDESAPAVEDDDA